MKRLCLYVLLVLFALTLSSGMAAEQDIQWVKDKKTGKWIKVKPSGKSGSKFKVKETGKKYKVKKSSSGMKVKSTGAKIKSTKTRSKGKTSTISTRKSKINTRKRQGQTSSVDKAAGSKAGPVKPSGEKGEKKAATSIKSDASSKKESAPAIPAPAQAD